jgi:lipopolysaccharide/colanic/teichoic acid biosynthesis glycosyltransferase
MGVEGGIERALNRTAAVAPLPISRVAEAPQPHFAYFASRRLRDVVLGSLLLVLALPVLLVACVAILLTTRRSPLLLQRRVGLRGETFLMLKLRTMRDDAEMPSRDGRRGGDASATGASRAPCFEMKAADDPRLTRIGAVLRRTSIDELPQLVNVLLGQMSLVGPRPVLPEEEAAFPESWRRRFEVQPGLTGLWQVSGRSSLPVERWMALDRLYLRRRSFTFDLWLLLRTVKAVVTMRGAW